MLTRFQRRTLLENLTEISKTDENHYIKQQTLMGCGPTAIFNLLRWLGYNTKYNKHYKAISKLCNSSEYDSKRIRGTWPHDFERILTHVGQTIPEIKRVEYLSQPTIQEVYSSFAPNNALLINYIRETSSHYVLLICNEEGDVFTVNEYHDQDTKIKLTELGLHQILERRIVYKGWECEQHIDCVYPKMWIVSK